MDTSDPNIIFNKYGVCNHCIDFERTLKPEWLSNIKNKKKLSDILDKIKKNGKDKEYDCILGLSGGIDSSYLALKVSEWGLKPLVVHVDAGWNSELAVANIEKIVKHCNYNLHTHVVNWEDMRDLHLAYLRAGVANQDVPQDHIFFSSLYHFSVRHEIKYILSGGNIATESIFPKAWHGSAMDAINLKAIHKKHGSRKLTQYKTISFFQYFIWYPFFKNLRTIRLLNYIPYNKEQAEEELRELVGWKSYGRKHGESIFTKFFQNYYLPTKFGYDKRKPHLSSLIVSGQVSREQAQTLLKEPLYELRDLELDCNYFCKKLRITKQEFHQLLATEIRDYTDYPNWDLYYKLLKLVQRLIYKILRKKINVYS
jgi:N-acetyl sugar amidotransferase